MGHKPEHKAGPLIRHNWAWQIYVKFMGQTSNWPVY